MAVKSAKYMEMIGLKSGEEFLALKIFEDTPLRDKRYIKIKTLSELLDIEAMNYPPNMFYWKTEGESTTWEYDDEATDLSVQQLIDNCESVKAYCRDFYPDRVV